MVSSRSGGKRDLEKEDYWRDKLEEWRESGATQVQFCREQGLNTNTFSSWKREMPKRDSEARRKAQVSRARMSAPGQKNELEEESSTFLRFSPADLPEGETSASEQALLGSAISVPAIAAELIDASTGRRVRIFNGADQSTVAAVRSALSANSIGF